MKTDTKNILAELKEKGEDHEFYPSTDAIIKTLFESILKIENKWGNHKSIDSILDIGAGDGRVLNRLSEIRNIEKERLIELEKDTENKDTFRLREIEDFKFTKYAIEKSKVLIDSMSNDIYIIGTDFMKQTLIDKDVSITFSNPPYSQYVEWTEKILKETNSEFVYLVIPQRWKDNKIIKYILEKREIEFEILGDFDFLNSVDRKARAKVNLIKFTIEKGYKNGTSFDIWFNEHFAIKENDSTYERQDIKKERIKNSLLSKKNVINELVIMYDEELNNLLSNYKKLQELDPVLFEELGLDINKIKKGLKVKIEGLKKFYWSMSFDLLEPITNRLTRKCRRYLIDDLFKRTNIDFTESNIYAVIIWVIKNANTYFDDQILEIYDSFVDKKNIIAYKSNQRFIADEWRYIDQNFSRWQNDKITHYKLDYRLITTLYNNFPYNDYDKINNLNKNTYGFIKDILAVAKNLGVNINKNTLDNTIWGHRKSVDIKDNKGDIFVNIRVYSATVHFKFSQEFMMKLNIEAARLKGWVKSPKEASEEIEIPLEKVEKIYKKNLQLPLNNKILLEYKENE